MLIAIQDHFKVEDRGAIGYVDMAPEDRRHMALESRFFYCDSCGYKPPAPKQSEDASTSSTVSHSVRQPQQETLSVDIILLISIAVLIIAANFYFLLI